MLEKNNKNITKAKRNQKLQNIWFEIKKFCSKELVLNNQKLPEWEYCILKIKQEYKESKKNGFTVNYIDLIYYNKPEHFGCTDVEPKNWELFVKASNKKNKETKKVLSIAEFKCLLIELENCDFSKNGKYAHLLYK